MKAYESRKVFLIEIKEKAEPSKQVTMDLMKSLDESANDLKQTCKSVYDFLKWHRDVVITSLPVRKR